VCEPIFNKPLAEISFAQVLIRLFETARRFDMEIQPQLILLQKTLFNIEGLGRELYPQLDLWKTAHPVLKRWMDEQVGGRAVIDSIRQNLPQLREALRELPGVVKYLADQAATGSLSMTVRSDDLSRIDKQLASQSRQRFVLLIGSTAALCGTVLLALETLPWLGAALLAGAVVAFAKGRPRSA
ncbi:MAG: ubiquinone biosynthesis regulatory protein kinase UbiB, partial [Woeseia sp.]